MRRSGLIVKGRLDFFVPERYIAAMTLDQYLEKHGLTPEQFGARIGVTGSTIRRYLLGRRWPKREIVHRIVQETSGAVTVHDLLETPPSPPRRPGRRRREATCAA